MCVQTVGLIGAAIERVGISSVCVSLLREVTEVNRPPRALFVPFPLGFPLGRPHDAALQLEVIRQSLKLLEQTDCPVLEDFREDGSG